MSGLPKPRSTTSSPARRSSSFSRSISAKAYGGRLEIRRSSITACNRCRCKATSFLIEMGNGCRADPPEGARDVGAGAQAQSCRTAEAGEGAARDSRRIAGADRDGLRERSGGGRRSPPVVGALSRQAEGRDVHAAAEDSERDSPTREAPRDRGGLEPLRPRRRRADDAPVHQLHWLRLEELPNVFADLDAAGITTAGGCGDTVRNITGCPVAGLDAHELFD